MKMLVVSSVALWMVAALPLPARAQAAAATELYHVQFVKAAPGKIGALIEHTLKTPPDKNNPEPPVILRHAHGDDWQLLIVSALGKDETIAAQDDDPALAQWVLQARGLSVRHGDTFTLGPPVADARKALVGDNQPGAVYIVTTYEPVPGRRADLIKVLEQPAVGAAARLVLQHREGAPWQVLTITRYASWAAFAEGMQKERAQGPAVPPTNELIASHHDTIAERVTGPAR